MHVNLVEFLSTDYLQYIGESKPTITSQIDQVIMAYNVRKIPIVLRRANPFLTHAHSLFIGNIYICIPSSLFTFFGDKC